MIKIKYLVFSFWFIIIHTGAYTFAGAIALKLSKDLYEEQKRLIDYVRDMSDENDKKHVEKWFLPAQIIRGLLMSIVLYPILGLLGETSFLLRFIFMGGLMFVYTDVGSAIPFPHNVEGFIYMKPKYLNRKAMGKLYLEMVIYSVTFALLAGWFLF
ncbi:hypothetical protein ACO1PF_02775 [Alkalibacterium sp. f15]|uniref:hypothetical protein n=1 Tax=Alkalibacterium sp. f15 TaxID=3414029 RepID=UPI003BF87A9D